jgi:twinkle protein
VIDPWNELAHARPSHKSETEYISESLGQLRRFARIYDVHIWVLAHPTKPIAGNTSEPPGMWQIAGSNHFWNKADYGISIWRDPADPSLAAQCKVEKVRFRETGRPGLISFRYNGASRQIEEVN